ncbi:hypothetical protein E8A74_19765 [Polyangium fumosum]|uniref:Uncharacterized protein n=1 Tax=Polyangium fumosum TaxID=889272 RepID=A0A4U1JAU5_9BACT|nr:hypothetical protein E8A74_19765 [Polyangium fumosum]
MGAPPEPPWPEPPAPPWPWPPAPPEPPGVPEPEEPQAARVRPKKRRGRCLVMAASSPGRGERLKSRGDTGLLAGSPPSTCLAALPLARHLC